MSHRSLAYFLACPFVLLACGDSGDRTSAGASGTGVTSVGTSVTTATAGGTDTGSGTDATGNGASASSGEDPTTAPATTDPGTTGDDTTTGTTTSNTSNSTTGSTTGSTSTTNGSSDTNTTISTSDDSTTGDCASVSETAQNKKQPADIIFAIDSSGSMDMEIASVKANMNQFSQQIIASGIDVHVILIGDPGKICIGAPLGSGSCPGDTNLPTYYHHPVGVGSSNALQRLLDEYPNYKDHLRPDAATHIVVVSDDDSDLNGNTFHTQWKALDPGNEDYKFHAICGEKDVDDFLWCAQNPACCAFTAEACDEYIKLISITSGKWGDLCLQDFTPVFNELSTQVINGAALACEWVIPEPMGMPIDFEKVNVEFDDGMPPNDVFGKVNDPSECANVSHGWYYDDPNNPKKIFVCPQTCDKIQGVPNAKINIQFGCETLIAQ